MIRFLVLSGVAVGCTRTVLLIVLSSLISEGAGGYLTVPAPKEVIKVVVNATDVAGPVNRGVMGVCLVYRGLGDVAIGQWTDALRGVSGQIWGGIRYTQETGVKGAEFAWREFMLFSKAAGLAWVKGFNLTSRLNRKAIYHSVTDNNLEPWQQPGTIASLIRWTNKTPHPGFPKGYGLMGWEVWGEPQFPQNGSWSPADLVRYTIDVARAVRKVDPDIKIGLPLHTADMNWNRELLGMIAVMEPNAVDFVVDHPYDFFWIKAQDLMGSFYARASGAEVIRERRMRPKIRSVTEIAQGRWPMSYSEWNIHPQDWRSSNYEVSTDMAAALNVAGMFGVFWDEGIDSAQFFDLQGASRGHFHLSYQHGKELVVNPTGEVFRLYGRYFRGDRLRVKVDSPTYLYQWRDKDDGFELPVPLVIAQAANNREEGKLVVIMANRHRDGAAPAQVMLHNWRASVRTATRVTVTAQEPDLTETIIITGEDMLLPGSEGSIVALQLPPHSVTALLISGSVQP